MHVHAYLSHTNQIAPCSAGAMTQAVHACVCIPAYLMQIRFHHALLVLRNRRCMHMCACLPISCESDRAKLCWCYDTGNACSCACLHMLTYMRIRSRQALLVPRKRRCMHMHMYMCACLPMLCESDRTKLCWCYETGNACLCACLLM